MDTKNTILVETAKLLAREGVAGASMRKVASAVGIEASVIYSHFPSKLALLRATREYIARRLAQEMQTVSHDGTAAGRLRAMLAFQMKSRDIIIALLQYFMVVREDFTPHAGGYVPSRAYQHISEIITQGVSEGIFATDDIDFDAKAINHLVSGFLMEYFDQEMTEPELDMVVTKMHRLIMGLLQTQKAPTI